MLGSIAAQTISARGRQSAPPLSPMNSGRLGCLPLASSSRLLQDICYTLAYPRLLLTVISSFLAIGSAVWYPPLAGRGNNMFYGE